jgi:RNA ligase
VARPFAKFANLDQYGPQSPFGELPIGQPFEIFEKVDGSLIVSFDIGHGVELCTRGSFVSDQAQSAQSLWDRKFSDVVLPDGITVLFEYVAPWNRIVVGYPHEDLILLGALDIATGADVEFDAWPGRRTKRLDGIVDFDEARAYMLEHDTADAEGFVLRFVAQNPATPSRRAKVKYAQYLRLHRLVTGVSSITIWEHLSNGEPLDELLERVPDEFFDFVTSVRNRLLAQRDALVQAARAVAEPLTGLPRKDAALVITAQKAVPYGLVFGVLDGRDVEQMAWKQLRPTHEVPGAQARDES